MALKKAQSLGLWGRVVAIVAATLILSIVADFAQKALATYRVYQAINALEQEVAEAQAENQALQEQLAYSATDVYIHEAARELLRWVMPGDVPVVILSGTGEADPGQNNPEQRSSDGVPFWQLWWELFFGDGL